MADRQYTFDELCSIVERLRSPGGCPWDRAQTHESLKPCLLEETYEVLEGIDRLEKTGSHDNLCEELGDLLLQVLMHSRIAQEDGRFTLEDVISGISRKMIRRHPHVFGEERQALAQEVPGSWEALKKQEKQGRSLKQELEDIPLQLPALARAQKIQKKLAGAGGREISRRELLEKMKACLESLQDAPAREEPGGELLWLAADLLRRDGVYAELALEAVSQEKISAQRAQKPEDEE